MTKGVGLEQELLEYGDVLMANQHKASSQGDWVSTDMTSALADRKAFPREVACDKSRQGKETQIKREASKSWPMVAACSLSLLTYKRETKT